MNVGIVGLGLIGASMARAAKARGGLAVLAYDRDETVLRAALRDGVCDGVLDSGNVGACQLVLVALWPGATVEYIRSNAGRFASGSIVSDLCGVKAGVCRDVRESVSGRDFTFIGAHPMAGRARGGYENADAALFEGASMLLTPFPETPRGEIQRLSDFFRSLGFGRIVETSPDEHDRVIAYTSQLAHVVSSAYVKSPTAAEHHGFSAGSYRDMTRVACLNEDMWTELFLQNNVPLKAEVDGLIARLGAYSEALGKSDEAALRQLLREGRETKERIDAEND